MAHCPTAALAAVTTSGEKEGLSARPAVMIAGLKTAVVIDSGLTVTDPDNQNLARATVTISSGFQTGDVLAASTAGTSITATTQRTIEPS